MAEENFPKNDTLGLFLRAMVDREPGKRKVKPSKAALIDLAELDLGESSDDSDFNVDEEKLKEDDDISINSDPDDDMGDDSGSDDEDNEEIEEIEQPHNYKTQVSDKGNLSIAELLKWAEEKQALASQQGIERPKVLVCAVCLGEYSDDANEIVTCDGCHVSVHEGCYGISDTISVSSTVSSSSTEPWFCDACKAGVLNPPCELCPNLGYTIFKETEMGRWVHLVCALYVPGVAFSEVDKLSFPTMFEMPYSKYGSKTCSLCEDERFCKTGVCIGCDAGMCRAYFHVTCAQREGLLSEVNHGEADQADPYYAHCKLHTDKELMRRRKRNFLALQLHMKQEEKMKLSESRETQDRLQRKLMKYREKYAFTKANRPTPWFPTQKMPRSFSTCASFFRSLLHKTKLMGVETETHATEPQTLGDIRKKWHVPPAFNVEFITYYLDRTSRLQEMKEKLNFLLKENDELMKDEANLRSKYKTLSEEAQKIDIENTDLMNRALEIHDLLKGFAGRPLRLPPVIAALHNPPFVGVENAPVSGGGGGAGKEKKLITKAAAKMIGGNLPSVSADGAGGYKLYLKSPPNSVNFGGVDSASVMSIHTCSVCQLTKEQHLLIQCDTCYNYYHLSCLDPPLSRMPKKTKQMGWQCSDCCKSSDSDKAPEIDTAAPRRLRRVIKEPSKFSPSVSKDHKSAHDRPDDGKMDSSPSTPKNKIIKTPTSKATSKRRLSAESGRGKKKVRRRSLDTSRKGNKAPKDVSSTGGATEQPRKEDTKLEGLEASKEDLSTSKVVGVGQKLEVFKKSEVSVKKVDGLAKKPEVLKKSDGLAKRVEGFTKKPEVFPKKELSPKKLEIGLKKSEPTLKSIPATLPKKSELPKKLETSPIIAETPTNKFEDLVKKRDSQTKKKETTPIDDVLPSNKEAPPQIIIAPITPPIKKETPLLKMDDKPLKIENSSYLKFEQKDEKVVVSSADVKVSYSTSGEMILSTDANTVLKCATTSSIPSDTILSCTVTSSTRLSTVSSSLSTTSSTSVTTTTTTTPTRATRTRRGGTDSPSWNLQKSQEKIADTIGQPYKQTPKTAAGCESVISTASKLDVSVCKEVEEQKQTQPSVLNAVLPSTTSATFPTSYHSSTSVAFSSANPVFSTAGTALSTTSNATRAATASSAVATTANASLSTTANAVFTATTSATYAETSNAALSTTANSVLSTTAKAALSTTANSVPSTTANAALSTTANSAIFATANSALSTTANAALFATANAALSTTANAALSTTANAALSTTANAALSTTANAALSTTANAALSTTANAALSTTANPALSATANSALSTTANSALFATANTTLAATTNTAVCSTATSATPSSGNTASPATTHPVFSSTANAGFSTTHAAIFSSAGAAPATVSPGFSSESPIMTQLSSIPSTSSLLSSSSASSSGTLTNQHNVSLDVSADSLPSPHSESFPSEEDPLGPSRRDRKHREGGKKKKKDRDKEEGGRKRKKHHREKHSLGEMASEMVSPFRIKIKPLPPRPNGPETNLVPASTAAHTQPSDVIAAHTTSTTTAPPGYPPLPPGYTLTHPMMVVTPSLPSQNSPQDNGSSARAQPPTTPTTTTVTSNIVSSATTTPTQVTASRPGRRKSDPVAEQFSKCDVCGETGGVTNTVMCDECLKAYHFNCLEPPLKKSPKRRGYSWFCEDCDNAATSSEPK